MRQCCREGVPVIGRTTEESIVRYDCSLRLLCSSNDWLWTLCLISCPERLVPQTLPALKFPLLYTTPRQRVGKDNSAIASRKMRLGATRHTDRDDGEQFLWPR